MKLGLWLGVTASAAALVVTAGGSASATTYQHLHIQPAVHVSLNGRVAADPGKVTQYGSTSWAGYIALPKTAHGTFPNVDATFNVPSANCAITPGPSPDGTDASQWVGLDGWTDGTIEADGISSDCEGTTPVYYGWFDMSPLDEVVSTMTVSPGDAMQASVAYASGSYTLTLTDITTGLQQTYKSACPAGYTCMNSSAEVISEPASVTSILPLTDFGMENFDNVTISDRSHQVGGFTDSNWKYAQIVQVNTAGTKALDAPGALYGGQAFDDQWLSES
jgi:peptidase A4-like protein